jgi:LysM repeat protein
VVATVQAVAGVDYVEVDTFTGVPGDATPEQLVALGATLNHVDQAVAAQLATFQQLTHTVSKGETLTSVAAAYDLTVTELLGLNPGLADTDLTVGALLVVRRGIVAAQLVRFDPGVPDTIALHEVLP